MEKHFEYHIAMPENTAQNITLQTEWTFFHLARTSYKKEKKSNNHRRTKRQRKNNSQQITRKLKKKFELNTTLHVFIYNLFFVFLVKKSKIF